MKDTSFCGSAAANSNDLFLNRLVKLLQQKANEMSFDSFALYYAKYMLEAANRETTKEFLGVLGVPVNASIDVVYNELRK